MSLSNNKILDVILCLNASMILFPSNLKFVPIVLLLFYAFINLYITKTFDLKFFVFAAIPYFILVFGMFYTENMSYGFKKLETGASLILYPLCFAMLPQPLIKNQIESYGKPIFNIFCLSILIFSISIFFYFSIFEDRNLEYIIQHYITLIDKSITPKYQIHSIYLAMCLGLSVIFALYHMIKHSRINFLSIFIVASSIFILAVLNKRMAIIGLIIIGLCGFLYKIKEIKHKKTIVFVSFLLLFGLIITIISLPRYENKNSFMELYHSQSAVSNSNTSIGKRLFIYKNTLNLVEHQPIFGYGTGDAIDNLFSEMTKHSDTIKEKYNTHNQFFSYLLSTGMFGLFLFLYYLINLFRLTKKNNDILFLSLLAFFTLNMLSENILEREAGVLCFAFFANLFLRNNFSKNQQFQK